MDFGKQVIKLIKKRATKKLFWDFFRKQVQKQRAKKTH